MGKAKVVNVVENTETVMVGQLWADNDKRRNGRVVMITSITNDLFVEARVVRGAGNVVEADSIGRKVSIQRDRLRPTHNGYRYLG